MIPVGSRPFDLGAGRMLTPALELGVRRDGGDAETGGGVELGESLGYADVARTIDRGARRRATSRTSIPTWRRPTGGCPRQRDAGAADGRQGRTARTARGEPKSLSDIAVTGANETMLRAVAVFAGRAVRGATPRHYRTAPGSGRSRLPRPVARWGDPVVTGR